MMKYVESGSGYSHSVGYTYDTLNNLTALVEKVGSTTYTTSYAYDEDNRVTSLTTNGITESYTYDGYGRVTEKVTKNGSTTVLTEQYTYVTTAAGKPTGQVLTCRTVSSGRDVTYTYSYDSNGNIATVSDGTNTTRYTYDSANQLTREDNQAAGKSWTYTYDDAGNILSKAEYAYTTGTLGTAVSTVSYSYGDTSWGDLLTGYGGKTVTIDTVGNMLSDGTWTYTWEHGRELASMTGSGTTWSFTYDADGMRTRRTNGSTTYSYVYNGGSLSRMTVGSTTLDFRYDASGTPMTVTYGGTTYYYATNLQGDVVAILNSSGTAVVSYTYDAWGNVLSTTGSLASTLGIHNPLRYRGYVYDTETELYYLQSRYYDPCLGRFINADVYASTGQGILGNNMFAYCLNDPVNHIDKSGRIPDDWAGWMGEKMGEIIYEWLTGDDHPSNQTREVEEQIRQKQTEIIQDGVEAMWEAYNFSVDLENSMQHQQALVVNKFVEEQFSTPEKAISTLNGVGITLDAASAYCGAVALGWAVPTFGMSVKFAGSAAVALTIASLPFYGMAWIIERMNMEG